MATVEEGGLVCFVQEGPRVAVEGDGKEVETWEQGDGVEGAVEKSCLVVGLLQLRWVD